MAIYPFDQPAQEPQTWEQPPETYSPPPTQSGTGVPAIDVIDNETELWVYLDLPGYQTNEISVRGDETTLVVSATRPMDLEDGRTVVVRERPGAVERTIQLPASVDIANANMSYEDGVCKVELPKLGAPQFTELEFRQH